LPVGGLHLSKFPALFDAGFTGLANAYVQAIKSVLGERRPAYLFITHAHWDHIGSAGIFKRIWPEMKIVASKESRKILLKPSVIERVISLNKEALKALEEWGMLPYSEVVFESFEIDEILNPDESYGLDEDLTVQGFPSPGHTRDFVTYWIPKRRILIASEAVGCDNTPEFLVDYDIYIRDIQRFMAMNPRVLCTGHQLVLTGEDVQVYLKRAWEIAENYRKRVERFLEDGKDVEEIVEAIKQWEWDPKPFPKQPLETYLMNTRQRVVVLKKRWEARFSAGKT
jgi:glyoxylase-like metal-dependent hydrolase (beta-lactamase superfamily II)